MPNLRTFWILINLKTLLVTVLAVASTAICRWFGITADFPLTLIGVAIVFPIVFSIGGAYKRREAALDDYGSIKAHGRALYFAARDWLPNEDPEAIDRAKHLLGNVIGSCRTLFVEPISRMEENERSVYQAFSDVSVFINELRQKGLASGEVSRCNQFLSKMMISFESAKHIYQYRTPVSLRAYSDIFIVLLTVSYGPYFAGIGADQSPLVMFMLPVLLSVILSSLDNVQAHLENPFDQIGEDDVKINAEKFVARLEELSRRPRPGRVAPLPSKRPAVPVFSRR